MIFSLQKMGTCATSELDLKDQQAIIKSQEDQDIILQMIDGQKVNLTLSSQGFEPIELELVIDSANIHGIELVNNYEEDAIKNEAHKMIKSEQNKNINTQIEQQYEQKYIAEDIF